MGTFWRLLFEPLFVCWNDNVFTGWSCTFLTRLYCRPFLPCILDVRRPALTVELPYQKLATFWSTSSFHLSQWRDLNPQPADYETAALPIELHRLVSIVLVRWREPVLWNRCSLGSGVHHLLGVLIKIAVWLAVNLSSFPTNIASKPSHPHIECLICGDVGIWTQVYHTFLKVSTKFIISIYVNSFSKFFVLVVGLEPTTSTL